MMSSFLRGWYNKYIRSSFYIFTWFFTILAFKKKNRGNFCIIKRVSIFVLKSFHKAEQHFLSRYIFVDTFDRGIEIQYKKETNLKCLFINICITKDGIFIFFNIMHLEKVSVDWMVTSVNNESQNANLSVFLSDYGISNFSKNMDIY